MNPRLLDAFCGAGGCSMGYHRAGFDVVGVDIKPMPRYPFEFHQGDALAFIRDHGHEFDVIHASPPCQAHSVTQAIWNREYPDLIPETREALIASGLPYVIENVVGAPLHTTIELCGLMFGLKVYRHRRFESNVMIFQPAHQRHEAKCTVVGRRNKPGEFMTIAGHFSGIDVAREAMGIEWMTRAELAQSIPPAYTEYIGRQLIDYINHSKAA